MLELQYLNERLLHFIWQFQYYNKSLLKTDTGELLKIVKPGTYNTHQGPDFAEAVIQIDGLTLVGNIEVHKNASDWQEHEHQSDPHFKNVILHVVWNDNQAVYDINGKLLPTLSLSNRIPKVLLERYALLLQNMQKIPCASFLPTIGHVNWVNWKERLAIEILLNRTNKIIQKLQATQGHWEAVSWHVLAYNFGLTQNAQLFQQMAENTPIQILAKHKNNIHQLEAMLLGQANFFHHQTFDDKYVQMLQKEYFFLQKKYALKPAAILPVFLRMRPANFPTLRLAQLAMLIHQSFHLFDAIKEAETIQRVMQLFQVTANDYSHYHYSLTDEPSERLPKKLGKQMLQNLMINTVCPMLFAYGHYHNNQRFKNKALHWLSLLPAERNVITEQWEKYQVAIQNALDSQALIQLTRCYCNEKKCLSCAIGHQILKQNI
jgi:hypothetical protein